MEPTTDENETCKTSDEIKVETNPLCQTCHLILLPEYYFCPNCGTQAREEQLSVSTWSQTKLYALSAALPLVCFLLIGKWKGIKYLTSKDDNTRTVGFIASAILVISTIFTIWYTVIAVQKIIETTTQGMNFDVEEY